MDSPKCILLTWADSNPGFVICICYWTKSFTYRLHMHTNVTQRTSGFHKCYTGKSTMIVNWFRNIKLKGNVSGTPAGCVPSPQKLKFVKYFLDGFLWTLISILWFTFPAPTPLGPWPPRRSNRKFKGFEGWRTDGTTRWQNIIHKVIRDDKVNLNSLLLFIDTNKVIGYMSQIEVYIAVYVHVGRKPTQRTNTIFTAVCNIFAMLVSRALYTCAFWVTLVCLASLGVFHIWEPESLNNYVFKKKQSQSKVC